MKKLLFWLILITLFSCNHNSEKKAISPIYYNPDQLNFRQFDNKKIDSMRYCKGCEPAGNLLILYFNDETKIKVYSYKYDMKFYE